MYGKSLSVTEAVRHFSDYLNRVAYRHESFVLRRGNRPIAELRPLPSGRRLGDLPAILDSLPRLTTEEAKSFAESVDQAREALPPADDGSDPWQSC
jgi:antitoxin (DNA-binding transcriptional repressor) of toxin-antitoxin stability system